MSPEDPMSDDGMALIEVLQKADDGGVLRSLAETVLRILMEFEREEIDPVDRFQRRMMSMA